MHTCRTSKRLISDALILLACGPGITWTTAACASAQVNPTPPTEAQPGSEKGDQRPATSDQDKAVAPDRQTSPEGSSAHDAEKEILAKWDEIRGFSARIKIETATGQIIRKPGGDWEPRLHVRGKGTYELLKKEDKSLVRVELIGQSQIRHGLDDDGTSPGKLTRLYDGEFVYSVGEEGGNTHASKAALLEDDFIQLNGKDFFKRLHREFHLKRLPDETVGTLDAYVFEGKQKNGEGRTLYSFDKETGILVNMSMLDKTGKLANRLTIDDIKLNPEFHPKRFIFIAPRGVEVKELSAQ